MRMLKGQVPGHEFGVGTYGQIVPLDWGGAKLKVGNYTSFGPQVTIALGGEHNVEWVTTYPLTEGFGLPPMKGHPHSRGDIEIGSDVWIGMQSLILSGAKVGHGCVVGARSMLTHRTEAPPFSILVGSPARVVRMRFDRPTREALLRIAWWDWPTERIKNAIPLLQSPNVQEFINAVLRGEI